MKSLNRAIPIALMFAFVLLVADSNAQKKDKDNQQPVPNFSGASTSTAKLNSSFVDLISYAGFIPQTPTIYTGEIPVWNKDSSTASKEGGDKEPMLKLVANQERLKSLLPDFNIDFYIRHFSSAGTTYGISGVTGNPGNYEVTYDISKSTTIPFTSSAGTATGSFVRVGVGIRIKASITTFQPDIDVSSLWHLARAADNEQLKGGLSYNLFGIDGPGVINVSPNSNAMIEASSISSFMQSIAVLKSRLNDKDISLVPRVFAVQRNDTDIPQVLVGTKE
ncbi:MAG: hypothetical protein IM631_13335 [Cytophagales bacterium]|jgi:hypothetical protein|nr:hypothetical protein [Cytophagales bacterium]MCA6372357.1 hypothetical protein [Cytophagales bacterium]MCA6382503.1 hypothetical protein [Cytophagales bacterium]